MNMSGNTSTTAFKNIMKMSQKFEFLHADSVSKSETRKNTFLSF